MWTRRVTPVEGDLLFSYETRLGDAALMPGGVQACLGRRMALLRPDREVADPRYLLYMYLGPQFQRTIEQNTIHGATVERISLKTMGSWPVRLPDLREQRAIAEVLGALDDKIAANARLAATADELVGELYQRALEAGDCRTGWFFDFFTVAFGSAFKGEFFSDRGAGRPLIRIRDLKTFSPQVWTSETRADETIVRPGDVVVGMDADFTPTPWLGSEGLLNQRVCVVSSAHSRAFTLEAIRGPIAFIEGHKSGTTVIHLNKSDLTETRVVIPGEAAARRFDAEAQGVLDTRVNAAAEAGRLALLRDALLPQLMSGSLRVRKAREVVDAL
ncbi:restriction endonuclease subunit S [Krasilnikoviella flava]|nr:restriction endonuclease subunit S [Krasilnikoviella flava]